MSNFHCRCGLLEKECGYPDCHNGQWDEKNKQNKEEYSRREWDETETDDCVDPVWS